MRERGRGREREEKRDGRGRERGTEEDVGEVILEGGRGRTEEVMREKERTRRLEGGKDGARNKE